MTRPATPANAAKHLFEHEYDIPFPRTDVFRAFTDEAALTAWFCQHAQIGAAAGEPYRFWGKHTPHGLAERDADQRLTAFEPGRLLAFCWTWGGAPTRVALRFDGAARDPAATRLSVRHEADAEVAGHRPSEVPFLMDDFWSIVAANVRSYLKTGAPALLPDHTPRGRDVVLSIDIDASPETVWKCLIEPEQLNRWLSSSATVEARVGGAYRYGWEMEGELVGPTKILELEPGRRLVHDWSHKPGSSTSRTEWTLEPITGNGGAAATRVTVRQVGVTGGTSYSGYTNGWAKFLLALQDLCG